MSRDTSTAGPEERLSLAHAYTELGEELVGFRGQVVVGLIAAFFGILVTPIESWLFGVLVGRLLPSWDTVWSREAFPQVCLVLAAFYGTKEAGGWLNRKEAELSSKVASRVGHRLRAETQAHSMHLREFPASHDQDQETQRRYIDNIVEATRKAPDAVRMALVFAIAFVATFGFLDARLALVTAPVGILGTWRYLVKQQDIESAADRLREATNEATRFTARWTSARWVARAKALGATDALLQQGDDLAAARATKEVARVVATTMASWTYRRAVGLMQVTAILAGIRWRIPPATFAAYWVMQGNLIYPIISSVESGSKVREGAKERRIVRAAMRAPHERREGHDLALATGALSLRGVCVPERNIWDLDLDIAAGERVALRGKSGSGKTTIAEVICGLIEYWGSVTLGTVALEAVSLEARRSHIVLHSQEATPFDATVRENANLGMRAVRYSDDQIEASARAVGIVGLLSARQGLDTVVGEASHMSGGQRGRVSLIPTMCRALGVPQPAPTVGRRAGPAAVLVLDEATAHLDAESQRDVWACLDGPTAEAAMTVIVITHGEPPSWATRWIELGDGQVVYDGPPR